MKTKKQQLFSINPHSILFQKMASCSSLLPVAAVIFFLWMACIKVEKNQPITKEMILVSQFPLTDWCRQIAPPGIKIEPFLDYHYPDRFQLRPGIRKKLAESRLFIRIGGPSEAHLYPFFQPFHPFPVTEFNISLRQQAFIHTLTGDEGQEGSEVPWLDPIWAQDAIRHIADAIKDLYPGQEDWIERKTQDYLYEIHKLHLEIAARVSAWPQKHFIGENDMFQPLAKRYGLQQLARLTTKPWVMGEGPSISHQIKKLQNLDVFVVFVGPWCREKSIVSVAGDANYSVFGFEPFGCPVDSEHNTYVEMMHRTLVQVEKGLGGTARQTGGTE
jgi:ABC-type Zn uptake system ZnuABC Zn-binding protein ZnuA